MKKYQITAYWNHGFVQTYDVTGGVPGSRADAIQSAKNHLNSVKNIDRYKIEDENGEVVYQNDKNSRTYQ